MCSITLILVLAGCADLTAPTTERATPSPAERATAGADQRAAEHRQLADPGEIGDEQIVGDVQMARGIGEHRQRAGDHYGRQDRQPVQAVGQIDRVRGADDDEIGQQQIEGGRTGQKF